MDKVMYKIIFEGDLMPGYELPVVQRRIAELFGIEAEPRQTGRSARSTERFASMVGQKFVDHKWPRTPV